MKSLQSIVNNLLDIPFADLCAFCSGSQVLHRERRDSENVSHALPLGKLSITSHLLKEKYRMHMYGESEITIIYFFTRIKFKATFQHKPCGPVSDFSFYAPVGSFLFILPAC